MGASSREHGEEEEPGKEQTTTQQHGSHRATQHHSLSGSHTTRGATRGLNTTLLAGTSTYSLRGKCGLLTSYPRPHPRTAHAPHAATIDYRRPWENRLAAAPQRTYKHKYRRPLVYAELRNAGAWERECV
ncbi:hypothetical protein E2C01_078916 [Portunus trituberculatus]|uniref:Uncharacterized protein n=1 Tax=Portunus trituberculatus TaxID=210409 RepID=A0A5B7IU70_PORTR|nr:hypothetical protein [Portunus trituberculatus]